MQEIIAAKHEEIVALCRKHHVRRFSVFGSAVRGDFDPASSDIDIRVEFDRNALGEDYASNYFALRHELEELFGRKVDLLSGHTISNRYLKREIEQTQVTLYAA